MRLQTRRQHRAGRERCSRSQGSRRGRPPSASGSRRPVSPPRTSQTPEVAASRLGWTPPASRSGGGGARRLHFPPRLRWSARSAFVLNILGSALGQVHSLICRPSACTPGGASLHSDSKMIFFMSAFCLQEKITNGPSPIFFIVIFYPFIIYYYFNGVQEGWAFKQMNLACRLELEAPNLKRLC